MALTATFYNTDDDNRVLDKTLTAVKSDVSIIYKDNTDKKNPVLECAYDAQLLNANYLLLDGYYYFITDLQYSQQRIFLTCHTDLLMTYKDDIKNSSAIIARNAKKFFTYIKDDKLPMDTRRLVTCQAFPDGFSTTDDLILVVNGR